MSRPILSEEERGRIREAVKRAEQKTEAEIVPMVVRASDRYGAARWRLAVASTLVFSAGLLVFAPSVEPLWILIGLVPQLLLGHALASWSWLFRRALSHREVQEEVRQRAYAGFVEHGVASTAQSTGVLILVSLLEHRIEVLADRGIDQRAPEGYWQQIVDHLSTRIRQGALADGLCEAIEKCGALLAQDFPIRPDDENELADDVIVSDT